MISSRNYATLSKELEVLKRKEAGNVKGDLVKEMIKKNGVNFIACELNLDAKSIKDLAFQLKSEHAPFLGVFASRDNGKAGIAVAVSDDVISEKGLNAGDIVKRTSNLYSWWWWRSADIRFCRRNISGRNKKSPQQGCRAHIISIG